MAATRTRDDDDIRKGSHLNLQTLWSSMALLPSYVHYRIILGKLLKIFGFARLIKTFLDEKGEMKYEALHNPQCIAERLFGTFLYIQYTHTHTHKQKQNSAK